jgi:aspartyl-tRNA(Asn)/glutamyl-tRNA(Gln) amidotransferase subunit C
MSLTENDLAKIAHLARLSLREEELLRLPQDLDKIFNLVAELSEVDIRGVEPMSHAEDRALALMDDVAREPIGQESLKMSQGYEDGIIRVPKIIE